MAPAYQTTGLIHRHTTTATGRAGVAAIGVAQEFAPVFIASKKQRGKSVWFSFTKADRRVTCFISICGTPISGRRSSRSAPTSRTRSRCGSTATSGPNAKPPGPASGSASCPTGSPPCRDPAALQAICDRLGPGVITVFAERWWSILPLPLTEHDRAAGYWWELSMRQVETSRTWCSTRPATPRVLRGAGGRQPRHRPPGGDRADLQTRPTAGTPGGRRNTRRRSSATAPRSTSTPSTGTRASSSI